MDSIYPVKLRAKGKRGCWGLGKKGGTQGERERNVKVRETGNMHPAEPTKIETIRNGGKQVGRERHSSCKRAWKEAYSVEAHKAYRGMKRDCRIHAVRRGHRNGAIYRNM